MSTDHRALQFRVSKQMPPMLLKINRGFATLPSRSEKQRYLQSSFRQQQKVSQTPEIICRAKIDPHSLNFEAIITNQGKDFRNREFNRLKDFECW